MSRADHLTRARQPEYLGPAAPLPVYHPFMFATGIECSYPVITGKDGTDVRMDELALTGHYQHWKDDFRLVKELGIHYLRYGLPLYRLHLGPGRYDWALADETLAELRRLEIVPIIDLCHFGVPDWAGNFQNREWPEYFAEYAGAFAQRFPWVRFYTPVNEMNITAKFSAKLGWWNERLASDRAYVTAVRNVTYATILAEEAILRQRPDAVFIHSESTEYCHAAELAAARRAAFLNQLRFLCLDLCYGVDLTARIYQYLLDHGVSREEYHWLLDHGEALKPSCIMGNDYYASNEHMVPPGNAPIYPSGRVFGYYIITRQYYERYHLPVMYTETNQRSSGQDAPAWLAEQWANMVRLKLDGVPIVGFTWYSLQDQVDWDSSLRCNDGHINPLGLCDLNRQLRPVGTAYRKLIEQWHDILPMETRGLNLHQGGTPPGGTEGTPGF